MSSYNKYLNKTNKCTSLVCYSIEMKEYFMQKVVMKEYFIYGADIVGIL